MKRLFILSLLWGTQFTFAQSQLGNTLQGLVNGRQFGSSVALSQNGNRILVATNGEDVVRIYDYDPSAQLWQQVGNDISGDPEYAGDFGEGIALSSDGSTIAVGDPIYGYGTSFDNGQVKVYRINQGVWSQVGNTLEGTLYSAFGTCVSLSENGNTLAVSATASPAYIKVYTLVNNQWQEDATFNGDAGHSYAGTSLDISSDGLTVAYGTPNTGGLSGNFGTVKVFRKIGGVWQQMGSNIDGNQHASRSGSALSLSADGNTVAIGAPSYDISGMNNVGQTRVFNFTNGSWNQVGNMIVGDVANNSSGWILSLSDNGEILSIGEPVASISSQYDGRTRTYYLNNNVWTALGTPIVGNANDQTASGMYISGDGKRLAIGSPAPSPNNPGFVKIYELPDPVLANEEINFSTEISIFPNPANEVLNISTAKKISNVRLHDVSGKLVISKSGENMNRLDISTLSPGVYILIVRTTDGALLQKKMIKK